MCTFRITYKDFNGNTKSDIMQADHASEALSNAEDDWIDYKEVVKIEQLN